MTGPVRAPDDLTASTAADRRAQLEEGMSDLRCGHCDGLVRVKKNSLAHTSIQWSTDAVRRCGSHSGRDGCPHLYREVSAALTRGQLVISGD